MAGFKLPIKAIHFAMASHVRAHWLFFRILRPLRWFRQGICARSPQAHHAPRDSVSENDHLIHIDSDDAMVDAEGHAAVSAGVTVRQDARTVAADSMNYDYKTGKLSVKGGVDFEDPKLRIQERHGIYDTVGGADSTRRIFRSWTERPRRRRELTVQPDGRVALAQCRYTTARSATKTGCCKASPSTWTPPAKRGRRTTMLMRSRASRIFYTPYISFHWRRAQDRRPVSQALGTPHQRVPTRGALLLESRSDYDLTLTPAPLRARHTAPVRISAISRRDHVGKSEAELPADDRQRHFDRSYFPYHGM